MRLRRLRSSAVISAALLSIVAFALVNSLVPSVIPSARAQTDTQFFPMGEVRPGLKGVGRTILEGDKVTEFQVEMLGILKNVLAPKHDAILARFSGGGLEKTGVVAGMSGSPVYVDGKLVGAVAISFPFEKEPYGVITPIKDMLAVVPGPDTARSRTRETAGSADAAAPPRPYGPYGPHWRLATVSGGSAAQARLIPDDPEANPSAWAKLLTASNGFDGSDGTDLASSLRLPLRFSGFPADVVNRYSSVFRALGFEPLAGGALTGASFAPNVSKPGPDGGSDVTTVKDLEPGSMVSLLFVRGDLNLNADCTVTYRQGSSLYACGHQIFLIGPTRIPFAPARVLATVPSLSASFKVDAPGEVAGSIHQDRFGAIYGVVGDHPPSIPVHIRVNSTLNRTTDYNFQVAEVPVLSPLLVNLGLVSTLTATERMAGPSTYSIKGAINLANGDGVKTAVKIDDVIASEAGAAGGVGAAVATPLNYLLSSGFPGLRVEGIDLTVSGRNEYRAATLEQVWSTKSEVQPGDHIEVTAVLRTPSGESLTERIPVEIPLSAGYQNLTLMVGGGSTINALEGRFTPLAAPPRDVQQAVRALNRMRRDNRVYALLMAPQSSFRLQGDEFPSPPPSLLQTFLSDPAAASRVMFSGTSVVGDFETAPTPYTIQGQQMLSLKVIAGGD
ncbi:MAG TPA: SpoIVB peptidase S55 domain-containing protein [Terriglobia bacterium]|nr:SpoIVB peptidase S55 domain-containing protein [Terriglobia bacterium]